MISASRALSEFSKKAAGESISLETFKSICIRESWVTDLFSQEIIPKELSNIKLIS